MVETSGISVELNVVAEFSEPRQAALWNLGGKDGQAFSVRWLVTRGNKYNSWLFLHNTVLSLLGYDEISGLAQSSHALCYTGHLHIGPYIGK